MTGRLVVLAVTVLLLVTVPGVAAEAVSSRANAPSLASTGVNIVTPILVGLILLVIGLALTAWAFLRGGSSRHRQGRDRTGTPT